MKFNLGIRLGIDNQGVSRKVNQAGEKALKNVVIKIERDAKHDSPFLTGNNERSITSEVKGMTGKVYSTSGYGGYLEAGTARMPARPYFKPALDRHIGGLPNGIKGELK